MRSWKQSAAFRRLLSLLLVLVMLVYVPVPARAASKPTPAQVEDQCYKFLTGTMGMNKAAAAGILANIYAESSFRLTAISSDGYASYGLCQWTASRRSRLSSWCKKNKLDMATVKGQMSYLEYELKTYYPTTYKYLCNVSDNAQGAYDAAYYWCVHFEVPANRYKVGVYRGNLAKDTYWPKYSGDKVSGSASGTASLTGSSADTPVAATGFRTVNGRTYYYKNNKLVKGAFIKADGKVYYAKPFSGILATGFQRIMGSIYYFDSSGVRASGRVKIGTFWYRFDAMGRLQG